MPETIDNQTIGQRRSPLQWVALVIVPILIIVAFLVLTDRVIAANDKPKERKKSFNPLAVFADYARTESVQLTVNAQGEARPQIEIDLVPQVNGQIVKVSPNFIQGGVFKKGEVLVEIETADFDIAVIQAEADVAQAEQTLVREIAEGEIARRDFAELGRGNPSPLALRQPQRAQAEAAVKAAKGRLQTAHLQLERTKVRAPFNGRVRSKTSDLGQFVSPGMSLGEIFSAGMVEVRLPLTDNDLYKINLPLAYIAKDRASAPEVKLSAVIAGQRRYWTGRIMRTDSVVDIQTRGISAVAEVYDPFGKGKSEDGFPLAPGLFVDAEINGRTFENVITIPRDGLRPQDQVYLASHEGKVVIRDVEVLDTNVDRAVISKGIAEGDLVVLSPMEPSRQRLTLRVSDANDPSRILVEPPRPVQPKSDKKHEKKGLFAKFRRKKNDSKKPLKKSADSSGDKSQAK